ncbi:MAG: FkbM family methyltransferase [Alphaproteobacteria bacterium]|nr:FkbM family methyltransferase [Alphaproteobacteria bacterium]
MRKLFVNIVCLFIPNQRLRRELRQKWKPTKETYLTWMLQKEVRDDLCHKMSLLHNGDIATMPSGVKFYAPLYPWDCIQREVVDTGRFVDQDILEELRQYIPKNATILDIGANVGNHTLFFAFNAGGGAARIHSFEPVPETYRMLAKNVEINGLEKIVTTHNVGLGDKESAADIMLCHPRNIGNAILTEGAGSLKIKRLDDIDLGKDKIDFVKIDVEGFELKTLVGARRTLEKHKPPVYIESFDNMIAAVKEFFKSMGYNAPIAYRHGNWLFLPKDK